MYDLENKRCVKATSIKLFENNFPGMTCPPPVQPSLSSSLPWPVLNENRPADVTPHPQPPDEVEQRRQVRPSRARGAPAWYGEWVRYANLVKEPDPKTYKQAMKSANWKQWREAAVKEYETLIGKETWRLVPRPARRKIIRCKWVFRKKMNVDKSLDKLKARLVALGFLQIKGIDFHEVFLPTSRQESFRILVSVLAHKGWDGRSFDIKSAFLNGDLNEKIYMSQPEGFVDPDNPDWVCEILRSLYGLKQSPRQWNKKLHTFLKSVDLKQSTHGPSIYYFKEKNELKGLIVTHVDDLAVTGTPGFIKTFAEKLKSTFEISKDEPLDQFLSLQIKRESKTTASLNQSHYIEELVDRFNVPGSKSTRCPTREDFKMLIPNTSPEKIDKPYSNLIGGLLWIAQCTRPDISFAVNRLSQFLQHPSMAHWEAAVRVLLYLDQTKHLKLMLGGENLNSKAYSDADWAEDRHDRKSTTGYVFCLGEGSISWRSRKQKTVSLSSTESEYMAMSDSCREAKWLSYLLNELGIVSSKTITICVDNEGAEALAKNPSHHSRTKHIHTRYHFVRACVKEGVVSLYHVPSASMRADMLTKGLGKVLLENHRKMLNII